MQGTATNSGATSLIQTRRFDAQMGVEPHMGSDAAEQSRQTGAAQATRTYTPVLAALINCQVRPSGVASDTCG